ncbi:MAG: ABC transporter permease [Christensenellaceae bacterium]|nr:ABC transporter permease [Christensenellaceae bacterium]
MDFVLTFLGTLPGAITQGLIWGLMAMGVYVTFRVLSVSDLTVDGTLATGGAVCVILIRAGAPVGAAILIAFLTGLLCGLSTAFLHTKWGIPVILAGILTQIALYSVNLRVMASKANASISVDKYSLLISQRYVRETSLRNPLYFLVIFTVLVIGLLYWYFGTESGSALRATGANPRMARAQGINTDFQITLGLMIANGMVALAGALLAQYQGFADVNMGRGAIVIGLAAVIIGEVLTQKFFINFALKLLAVSIGSIVYFLVLQLVLQLGLNTNDLKLISALIVAVFLAVPHFSKRMKMNQNKGGEKNA